MADFYSRFHRRQLTLRDELAVDRTVLANERTLLGYIRTALGFLVVGLTFLHFLQSVYAHAAGYALMAVAAVILLIGLARFWQIRRDLQRLRALAGREERSEAGIKEEENY
jgi:putative membrane protein